MWVGSGRPILGAHPSNNINKRGEYSNNKNTLDISHHKQKILRLTIVIVSYIWLGPNTIWTVFIIIYSCNNGNKKECPKSNDQPCVRVQKQASKAQQQHKAAQLQIKPTKSVTTHMIDVHIDIDIYIILFMNVLSMWLHVCICLCWPQTNSFLFCIENVSTIKHWFKDKLINQPMQRIKYIVNKIQSTRTRVRVSKVYRMVYKNNNSSHGGNPIIKLRNNLNCFHYYYLYM